MISKNKGKSFGYNNLRHNEEDYLYGTIDELNTETCKDDIHNFIHKLKAIKENIKAWGKHRDREKTCIVQLEEHSIR